MFGVDCFWVILVACLVGGYCIACYSVVFSLGCLRVAYGFVRLRVVTCFVGWLGCFVLLLLVGFGLFSRC